LSLTFKWEFLKVFQFTHVMLVLNFNLVVIEIFIQYFVISFFILFHQKYCLKSLHILVPPGYTKYRVLWASFKIYLLISTLLGTHKCFWNHKVPSSCMRNPSEFPLLRFSFIIWSLGSVSYFTWISSTIEGYKVNTDNCTLACPCDTNWTPKFLSSFSKPN